MTEYQDYKWMKQFTHDCAAPVSVCRCKSQPFTQLQKSLTLTSCFTLGRIGPVNKHRPLARLAHGCVLWFYQRGGGDRAECDWVSVRSPKSVTEWSVSHSQPPFVLWIMTQFMQTDKRISFLKCNAQHGSENTNPSKLHWNKSSPVSPHICPRKQRAVSG